MGCIILALLSGNSGSVHVSELLQRLGIEKSKTVMNKSNYTAFYTFTFFVIRALFIDIGSVLYVNRATIVKAEFNVTVYSSRQLGSIGRTYVYVRGRVVIVVA